MPCEPSRVATLLSPLRVARKRGGEITLAPAARSNNNLGAIVSGKPIVLLDEPLSGLTDLEATPVLGAIKKIALSGITSLIVSHRQKLIRDHADRVYQLSDGRIINPRTTSSDNNRLIPVETKIPHGKPVIRIFSKSDTSKESITIHEGELVGISCPRMGTLGSKLLFEKNAVSYS
uniref:ABC transporter n=1 Tax=Candidatus Kentrum sp. LPFa TaxID=2126335 RepID=A0A450VT72_9GAMM|nr:MAG: hypothetical protein BECKLPF1236B_GA0070989_100333 [Candidatus Kentron sp. LPFa]